MVGILDSRSQMLLESDQLSEPTADWRDQFIGMESAICVLRNLV